MNIWTMAMTLLEFKIFCMCHVNLALLMVLQFKPLKKALFVFSILSLLQLIRTLSQKCFQSAPTHSNVLRRFHVLHHFNMLQDFNVLQPPNPFSKCWKSKLLKMNSPFITSWKSESFPPLPSNPPPPKEEIMLNRSNIWSQSSGVLWLSHKISSFSYCDVPVLCLPLLVSNLNYKQCKKIRTRCAPMPAPPGFPP